MKLDLYKTINKNNEYENEINNLKKNMNNFDKINKLKTKEYEKEIEFLKNRNDEIEKENENLKKIANDLKKYKNSKKNDNNNENINDLIDKNKKNEEKINNLNQTIKELINKINDLNLEIYNNRDNNDNNDNNRENNNSDNEQDNELKKRLFFLLIQKYIDKNIIFDKREFFNLLMDRKFKQNIRNLRAFNEQLDRKYKTADDSLSKLFKSKSKEKKIEMLRSSFKKDQIY